MLLYYLHNPYYNNIYLYAKLNYLQNNLTRHCCHFSRYNKFGLIYFSTSNS